MLHDVPRGAIASNQALRIVLAMTADGLAAVDHVAAIHRQFDIADAFVVVGARLGKSRILQISITLAAARACI
uniref:Uncharacterized protein n=1 Tax=Burkholderia cenocepacia TaxID=95486 RepID=B8R6B4_9BURK|nr:hypothetical protein Bck_08 [Burkholderia cenocepacia]